MGWTRELRHALRQSLHNAVASGGADLFLDGRNIGVGGVEAAREVTAVLHGAAAFEELWLGANHIGDECVREIAAALQHNTTLKVLNLSINHIEVDGARAIAALLRSNCVLEEIWLGGNKVGGDGAREIAAALQRNTTLTALWLGGNSLGDDGARAIVAVLHSHGTALKLLNLSGNHIGDDGARAIAAALHNNCTLEELNLFDNDIGEDGARAIAAALHGNNMTLTTLEMRGNRITDEHSAEVKALAALNAHDGGPNWGDAAVCGVCEKGYASAACTLLRVGARLTARAKALLVRELGEVPAEVLAVEREERVLHRRRMACDRRAALWGMLE